MREARLCCRIRYGPTRRLGMIRYMLYSRGNVRRSSSILWWRSSYWLSHDSPPVELQVPTWCCKDAFAMRISSVSAASLPPSSLMSTLPVARVIFSSS